MARGEATPQQKRFIDNYLKNRKTNQRQAAIDAGYSVKSVDSQASQLLKNPKVLAYLRKRESQIADELRNEFIFDALEARKVLLEVTTDPDAHDRDRIMAARDLLDRAGFRYSDDLDRELKLAEIEKVNTENELFRKDHFMDEEGFFDDGFLEALEDVGESVWDEEDDDD